VKRVVGLIAVAAISLVAGCGGKSMPATAQVSSKYQAAVARVCSRFHQAWIREHLDIALPDERGALITELSRSAVFQERQYRALAAIPLEAGAPVARAWLAAQRRLIAAFVRARALTVESVPRQRRRAAELARLDHMRYLEVRTLGKRFRPLQLLALAMRARHKTVVDQLPATMRRLRERQARFSMLNAPDSPVAIGIRYVATHAFPLAHTIESLARRVGAARCEPSRTG
jgi:hypothetical protein